MTHPAVKSLTMAAAVIATAALAGCSTITALAGGPFGAAGGTASPAAAGSATPAAALAVTLPPGQAKVVIDGQDQGLTGDVVVCTTAGRTTTIAISGYDGNDSLTSGEVVELLNQNGLQVEKASLFRYQMGYDSKLANGSAQVANQGASYTVTGTATVPLPQDKVFSKSFEIDATCP
jgi:ipoprotein LpqH